MCSIKIRHIKDALYNYGDFKSKYVQGIGALKWKSIIPVNVTYIITVQILHGCGISYTFNFMYYSEFQDSSEREDDIFQCCGHSCFHHNVIISEDW